ncbi:hypothetical protein [Burkholderia gladioli]|uniref:hypothetical protein n=1 Tax=Burkholderia gladioli TaxID=28095 RepID=UPI00163F3A2F|nr:hypothetical protein [Burkholderia gladioli]
MRDVDLQEIHALVEEAAGLFSWAGETLEQLEALFDSMASQMPESRLRNLAHLGRETCDDRYERFLESRDKFNCVSSDLYELLRSRKG